jgi:hypothetical protein
MLDCLKEIYSTEKGGHSFKIINKEGQERERRPEAKKPGPSCAKEDQPA